MQVSDYAILEKITNHLNFGETAKEPQQVSGGFMHKMYKLETTTGKYALKLLNPSIMKREDALANFARAEQLEEKLNENNIPIVAAIEIGGRKMQCVNGQYFYVFPWVEGSALHWNEIKSEHCKIAGMLLAKIHKIERKEEHFYNMPLSVDWDSFIAMSKERCPQITDILGENRKLLYSAQKAYNEALKSSSGLTCICDGDMDSKNVLWQNGKPLIIDLECLDYGDPFLEMFRLALDWSGGVLCRIDFEAFRSFISAYMQEFGVFSVNWQALSGIGFGWLEWLEYNIKRALMIECTNRDEQLLGVAQVLETVPRIVYYDSVREELLKQRNNLWK